MSLLNLFRKKKKLPFEINCLRDGLPMSRVKIASGESSEMYECSFCGYRYFRGSYYSPESFKILVSVSNGKN
jgi:hypothetical protein